MTTSPNPSPPPAAEPAPRRLLAIESATDWLSVALLEGEAVVDLRTGSGQRRHAAELLPTIEAALRESHHRLDDLDAIAVSTGPGSFTSLRIGLATAKGLAFGRSLGAIGVSTLEAMALSWLEDPSAAGPVADTMRSGGEVVALLDARRGEWYAGGFALDADGDGLPRAVLAEGLYAPAQLAADLAGRSVVLVCPEPGGWHAAFEAAGVRIAARVEGEPARPRADRVGRLAQRRIALGEGVPAASLSARYLRRAQAEAQRLGGPVEQGELARLEAPER